MELRTKSSEEQLDDLRDRDGLDTQRRDNEYISRRMLPAGGTFIRRERLK